jgi:2-iminobutanoate/2-iminopropanoate deaminase
VQASLIAWCALATTMMSGGVAQAQQSVADNPALIEYIHPEGEFVNPAPYSPGVKVGHLLFVAGTPAFDKNGKIAVNDFTAQMNQVMENITGVLKAAGVGWDRVVKVTVFLVRREDYKEMNRIYAAHFAPGKYPARTTAILPSLPNPDFLLEIDCEAVVD